MTVAHETTNGQVALALYDAGFVVIPNCWPDAEGHCAYPGHRLGGQTHPDRDTGKRPLISQWETDKLDRRQIIDWWRRFPLANVGINEILSNIVVVDPDTDEAFEEAQKRGVQGGVIRQSRAAAFLFRRPANCPIYSTTHQGASGRIDVLASGQVIVHGRHRAGNDVYLDILDLSEIELIEAPDWAVEMLRVADARAPKRPITIDDDEPPVRLTGSALAMWRGEIVVTKTSTVVQWTEEVEFDRSKTLFWIGRDLADAGATYHTIINAVADRDQKLGFAKYADRKSPETEYRRIADKVIDGATVRVEAPETPPSTNGHHTPKQSFDTHPWPDPPGSVAYAGLAGRIVDALVPYTEADPVALLVTSLVMFGIAVGPSPRCLVGATRHALRLNAALVGPTAKARKGDSLQAVLVPFTRADPHWAETRILSGMSSGEGLIWSVRDAITKNEPRREGKKIVGYDPVVEDVGVTDKRLLVRESEFARVLSVLERPGNTLSPIIRDAWDTGNLQTMTKNSPARATGAHIGILAHVTVEELQRELADSEMTNGFANRFIFAVVRRAKLLPEPEALDGPAIDALGFELRERLEWARTATVLVRTPAAKELWAAIYPALSADRDGLAGSLLARAEAQVLRLSALYALMDGQQTVDVAHVQSAVELWAFAERSVEYIFADASGDPIADTIMRTLRNQPELTRTQISDLFGRHIQAGRLDHALQSILTSGKVQMKTRATGGRPQEVWTIAP